MRPRAGKQTVTWTKHGRREVDQAKLTQLNHVPYTHLCRTRIEGKWRRAGTARHSQRHRTIACGGELGHVA